MQDALLSLSGFVLVCLVLYWIISAAVRSANKASPPAPPAPAEPHGFRAGDVPGAGWDEPGRFRVYGVVRATGVDIAAQYEADSAANAKAKAELKGIIVTRVERS